MTTRRERIRAQTTREIIDTARRQLADVGPAALSLRAIARDMGMVSSGIYRYFHNRDELLTALILDAYHAVGAAAESADSTAVAESKGPAARWRAVAHAVRDWALTSPHEFALLYGTPVPGYAAPADTALAAARLPLTLCRIVADADRDGKLQPHAMPACPPELLHPDSLEMAPAELDSTQLSHVLVRWMGLMGHISFELFGHLFNVVTDYDAYFAHAAQAATVELGLSD